MNITLTCVIVNFVNPIRRIVVMIPTSVLHQGAASVYSWMTRFVGLAYKHGKKELAEKLNAKKSFVGHLLASKGDVYNIHPMCLANTIEGQGSRFRRRWKHLPEEMRQRIVEERIQQNSIPDCFWMLVG